MELRNVATFLKVAELGKFSAAASELGYAQSTVTTQIQQLEAELGNPLFTRGKGSVELTEFGRRFLPLATDMHAIEWEMSALGRNERELSGTLRVGVIESLLYSGFLSAIARFAETYPQVTLEFYLGSGTQLHDMLSENRVDLIASLARPFDYTYMDVVSSCDCRVLFATTAANPLAQRQHLSIEEIARERLMLSEEESVYYQALLHMLDERQLSMPLNYRIQSSHAIKELVRLTDGVCFLPEYAIADELRSGELVALDTAFEATGVQVIVAQRREKWHSPQLHGLVAALESMEWL